MTDLVERLTKERDYLAGMEKAACETVDFIQAKLDTANTRIEALERRNAELEIDAQFLLSVIDSCDEAEAPSDEMEPEDVANIARIRKALSHSSETGCD